MQPQALLRGAMMPKVDVDQMSVVQLLQAALEIEKNAELAFTILACAAAALARDVGGLDCDRFLHNCREAYTVTPQGLVAPGAGGPRFDA